MVVAALERGRGDRYSARRAQKQFDAADPENRLVADELERNRALEQVRVLELKIESTCIVKLRRAPLRTRNSKISPPISKPSGMTITPMHA
jgi:hypothetical protein